MFNEQELLTLSYGLVTLLSELDNKRRKIYVRWREAAEEEEDEAMEYYDRRLEEIRTKTKCVKELMEKLDKITRKVD